LAPALAARRHGLLVDDLAPDLHAPIRPRKELLQRARNLGLGARAFLAPLAALLVRALFAVLCERDKREGGGGGEARGTGRSLNRKDRRGSASEPRAPFVRTEKADYLDHFHRMHTRRGSSLGTLESASPRTLS
jgi:hypothetical protein